MSDRCILRLSGFPLSTLFLVACKETAQQPSPDLWREEDVENGIGPALSTSAYCLSMKFQIVINPRISA